MRRFVKYLTIILPTLTKGLKLQHIGKTWFFKNDESCRLTKEHFGNESFSFNLAHLLKPRTSQNNLKSAEPPPPPPPKKNKLPNNPKF